MVQFGEEQDARSAPPEQLYPRSRRANVYREELVVARNEQRVLTALLLAPIVGGGARLYVSGSSESEWPPSNLRPRQHETCNERATYNVQRATYTNNAHHAT